MQGEKELVTLEKGMTVLNVLTQNLLDYLDEGVSAKNKKKLFTNTEYMQAYTVVHEMCTQKQPHNYSDRLYDFHEQTIKTYLGVKMLPALKGKRDVHLLNEFATRWETFR